MIKYDLFVRRLILALSLILLLLVVSRIALLVFLPKPPLLDHISFSRAVYDEKKQLLRLTLSQDAKYRLWLPLSDMAPALIDATLLQEDQYFYWHLGVNPWSFLQAAWKTYVLQSRRIGASTITMQVARLRFGLNSKTLSGKTQQVLRAFQLEYYYSKEQILEAYLNLAPYGNNIEGVGAASYLYFAKSARALNLPEALTLVVVPQNPSKRMRDKQALKTVRNKLYARWLRTHPQDEKQRALMNLPLQMLNVRAAPFLAPHFVNTVLTDPYLQNNDIVTTLDLRLQHLIERITQHYVARKIPLGVNNAAVLLVDTRDMSVKAMVGSFNFFDHSISGQINGTAIKRSPGSTLKPFIYALALDQGLIHPGSILKDVPRSFGSYNPENFDNDFVGPIHAKDALVLSRNVPAVFLAEQLKNPSLYAFLHYAGVSDLKAELYYGLALVLGGAELSMQELVGLYAALVNDGVWHPLRMIKEDRAKTGKRLLSAEASFLVLDMLNENKPFPVAWKTGTSSAHRDAWSIGTFGPYVLGVWLGNFNNQSNPAFVGKELAAPLFFELAHAIHAEVGPLQSVQKNPAHLQLTQVAMCKASGMLPTRYCTDTENIWFIPGKSPIKTDTIFREVAINAKTGLRTCHFDQHTRFEIFEFWSSDLLKIYQRAGIQRRLPPAYEAHCASGRNESSGFQPQIISPERQLHYITRIAPAQTTFIPFSAVVDADVRELHWFIDATYLGKTTRDKSLLWPAKPGHYIVRVVDDAGRSDASDLTVRSET